MNLPFRKKNNFKKKNRNFDPDEIFVDSLNVSGFDTQQMEGSIEKPISKRHVFFLQVFIVFVFLVFSLKIFSLQLVHGNKFFEISEKNLLREIPLFAERGIIFDRNGKSLAWNEEAHGNSQNNLSHFSERRYTKDEGFSQILGYVQYPKKDKNGYYWSTDIYGISGVEKNYNDTLTGTNGSLLIETNAKGEVLSKNRIQEARNGHNIHLTIDADLQKIIYAQLKNFIEKHHFIGGGVAMMDIHNGELIALVSYPEFSSEKMTNDRALVKEYLEDKRKPFFNRIVSGLYPPGSTVKPFIALAALNEHIISPSTKILSTGKIEISNPYNPSRPSIYRDWKRGGHGLTDVKKAIAESVNTFFYAIGGGYKNQKGLGIEKIHDYLSSFQLAHKTNFSLFPEKNGVIPSPQWKEKTFHEPWRLGDTYISSIGQFGFVVSPLQMLRSVASLANGGFIHTPHIVKEEKSVSVPLEKKIDPLALKTVKEGMRDVVTKGTARNVNFPFIHIAAKTGTAQVGKHNEYYDSWIVGFFPYEKPRYAFVVFLEKGQKEYGGSASTVLRNILLKIQEEYPKFIELYVKS